MRQRDPAERRALAALHDGDPGRWLDWATSAGRVDVVRDGRGVLEQAVSEWAAGGDAHGPGQSVMIARDNDTRRALNELAREHRREAGELGEEHSYGPVTIAVGDRVICRNNERDLDVDNGTRGTVRHVDERRVVIETDAHSCASCRRATSPTTSSTRTASPATGCRARPSSRRPSSRARRPDARLVLHRTVARPRRDTAPDPRRGRRDSERDDHRPGSGCVPTRSRPRCIARSRAGCSCATTRTSRSTNSPRPGEHDDPQLRRPRVDGPCRSTQPFARSRRSAQPRARPGCASYATRSSSCGPSSPRSRRASSSNSTTSTRARELTERRDTLRGNLDRLPDPRERRFGRQPDPHIVDRTQLASALRGIEAQLDRALTTAHAVARQVGDPDAIRSERDGLTSAIDTSHEQRELRNDLADREVHARPRWLRDALGERPDGRSEGRRWDHAAQALARYRVEYDIQADADGVLSREPADREQQRDYAAALRACDRVLEPQRDLPDLGLGGL